MKRSCWGCRALKLSQTSFSCELGYAQTDNAGGVKIPIKPVVQCPKPLTVKEFVRLYSGGEPAYKLPPKRKQNKKR